MKKAILISIRPEWVEKILNGSKTIEIRRNMPKCELPIDVYIYCSKGDVDLYREFIQLWNNSNDNNLIKPYYESTTYFVDKQYLKEYDIKTSSRKQLNGKVVAKFTLNKVEELACEDLGYRKIFYTEEYDDLVCATQLSDTEMEIYFCDKELKKGNVVGYAWHIENLQIFDKPFELRHFYNKRKCNFITEKCFDCQHYYQNYSEGYKESCSCPVYSIVNKTPQSWQYVYVVD